MQLIGVKAATSCYIQDGEYTIDNVHGVSLNINHVVYVTEDPAFHPENARVDIDWYRVELVSSTLLYVDEANKNKILMQIFETHK